MVTPDKALPGRSAPVLEGNREHLTLNTPIKGPYPETCSILYCGMGCFWGAERLFWQKKGVWTTAVGYQGGYTPHPTYDEVCSGRTGHAETVMVVYEESQCSTGELLKLFWEGHDPTQGMRQGNDRGTQYRSALYLTTAEQAKEAETSRNLYHKALKEQGLDPITTQIEHPAPVFYFAEDHHQQYLAKNPQGYCGLGGTGVTCPMAVKSSPAR
jgi:peptide-methionine (S)-S-oxide reductase